MWNQSWNEWYNKRLLVWNYKPFLRSAAHKRAEMHNCTRIESWASVYCDVAGDLLDKQLKAWVIWDCQLSFEKKEEANHRWLSRPHTCFLFLETSDQQDIVIMCYPTTDTKIILNNKHQGFTWCCVRENLDKHWWCTSSLNCCSKTKLPFSKKSFGREVQGAEAPLYSEHLYNSWKRLADILGKH